MNPSPGASRKRIFSASVRRGCHPADNQLGVIPAVGGHFFGDFR
jgi:hypothetical protein